MILKSRSTLLITAAAVVTAAVVFASCVFLFAPDESRYIKRSQILTDRNNEIISYNLAQQDYYRFHCSVNDVDPIYIKMLLASEDKRFGFHMGVDPVAVARAVFTDLKSGHVVSGASTLAMQVSRMLERRSRTLLSKIKEAFGAIYLTLKYGNDGVLERYLTLAPMGGNVEGVQAGALKWFGHSAKHLTPAEAAFLVALPRAPELIRPDIHPENAQYYRAEVIRLALKNKIINKDVAQPAINEALPDRLKPISQIAYALGNRLFYRSLRTEFYSKIDRNVQITLNTEAGEFLKNTPNKQNTAIVVIDNAANEVIGYLGSGDLKRSKLDLAAAIRSPGSTLKPFAYALAFEQNLLHPQTVIHDKREAFGSWVPRNYSGQFRGEVSAADALANSLNIPALKVLQSINSGYFLENMNLTHKAVRLPKGADAKLALVLGGCGISLLDLTELYSMLNRDGMLVSDEFISYTPNLNADEANLSFDVSSKKRAATQKAESLPKTSQGIRLLSAQSARAVFEILKTVPRPEMYALYNKVSYKTGTSFQNRDALAVGSQGALTIGVWTGRPDNRSVQGITGYKDAAPLLFRLFDILKPQEFLKPQIEHFGPLSPVPPESLKDLGKAKIASVKPLKITFPQEGSTVIPDSTGAVIINVEGGSGEYTYTVDSRLQFSENFFTPQKDGYYNVAVTDSKGSYSSVNFNVKIRK